MKIFITLFFYVCYIQNRINKSWLTSGTRSEIEVDLKLRAKQVLLCIDIKAIHVKFIDEFSKSNGKYKVRLE